jgi:transketolase
MRNLFVDEVNKIMREDEKIIFVSAECGFSVVEKLQEEFPDRFYNVGIAEQSLVGTTAGMALRGLKPVAYTMAMFLSMRAFEQIRIDVVYQKLPVLLAAVIPGLGYGNAGTTHHSIEDAALMRVLPGLNVIYPSCETDVRVLTRQVFAKAEPCYLGLGRAPLDYTVDYVESDIQIGKSIRLSDGKDAAIIATGSMVSVAVRAKDRLKKEGINISVYNMHTLKPLDIDSIRQASIECGTVFTLEEASIIGGLGGAVAEYLAEQRDLNPAFLRLGIRDFYPDASGTIPWLYKHFGIDVESVTNSVKEALS